MKFSHTLLFTLLISVLTLTACKDDHDDDHDHASVGGLVIKNIDQTRAVTVWSATVKGSLFVTESTETDHMIIRFLNEKDSTNQFLPDEVGYSLLWTIADTSVAMIEQHSHDGLTRLLSTEDYEIILVGKKVGSTSLVLKLLHSGHTDFQTPAIPIIVGSNK